MEGLPLLVTILDANLHFIWLNKLARSFYGFEVPDLVGKSAEEILHVGDSPRLYELRREALQTKQQLSEIVHVRRDGRIYTFAASFQPVCDDTGNLIYLVAAHRDISRETRVNEARDEVYELFNRILDTMPLGFVAADRSYRIMRSNTTACQILHSTNKDILIGKSVETFLGQPNEIALRLEQHANEFAVDAAAVADLGEVVANNLDGQEFPVRVWGFQMKLGDFPLIAFLLMDLSDIRDAEAKVLETQQQLQQMQKHEALGQLAGNVAHDFNNLMAIIMGYSDIIREKTISGSDNFQMLDEIQKTVERGTSLTRQILAYAKHQNLDLQVTSVHELIRNQESMLRTALSASVNLEVSLAACSDRVRLDEGQLMQVLLNLTVNARDAMPDGGKLQIRTENTILNQDFFESHAHSGKAGSYLALSVRDNGCGIPKHLLQRVFDPYFSTKPRDKGTGLGLSVVYGIIKQLNGFIYCKSHDGAGTEFSIYLPVSEEAAHSEVRAMQTLNAPLEPKQHTVLIVDDEEPLRLIISKHLQMAGYQTYSASGGRDALNFIDAFPRRISLILSDIMMPEMNGLEMADEALLMQPDTPVLFMSGYSKELLKVNRSVGDHLLITKPFSREVLLNEVEKILFANQTLRTGTAAFASDFDT